MQLTEKMNTKFAQPTFSYFQAMRRHQRAGLGRYLNLAPMMDVMFNLLIFFLATTTFKMPEGTFAASLPRQIGLAVQLSVPTVPVRILLAPGEQTTTIYVNCSVRIDDALQGLPMQNYEELYQQLVSIKARDGFDQDSPVVLAAKDNVPWQEIMQAYNSAMRASFKRIVFSQL